MRKFLKTVSVCGLVLTMPQSTFGHICLAITQSSQVLSFCQDTNLTLVYLIAALALMPKVQYFHTDIIIDRKAGEIMLYVAQ